MCRLNIIRPKIKIDLIDSITCPLMINQRAGAKFGDRKDTRTRHEFVLALTLAPPWHVGRERQARKVVPWQKTFCCEIAVGIEIALLSCLLPANWIVQFRLDASHLYFHWQKTPIRKYLKLQDTWGFLRQKQKPFEQVKNLHEFAFVPLGRINSQFQLVSC